MSSSFPVESLETFIVATLESSVVMTAETQENYNTTILSNVFLVFLVTLVEATLLSSVMLTSVK